MSKLLQLHGLPQCCHVCRENCGQRELCAVPAWRLSLWNSHIIILGLASSSYRNSFLLSKVASFLLGCSGVLGRCLHSQRLLPSAGNLQQELQRDHLHSLLRPPAGHCWPLGLHPTHHLPDSPAEEDGRWVLIMDTACPRETNISQECGF